ncbi:hypothetical protein [Treponema sp.]|uniref:YczE/YyaS/YitT family protein n=1 Tax=Treponema sp. TaxID=166 RepID=UPI00298DAFB0|nr:hypothetical protein [Treponema sp.]MCR5614522.1 hypothetical protein [Treponema sp.]
MKFTFKQFIVPNFAKRLVFMLPAVILMGVFVSILVEIGWGTDPASFMNLNIAATLGWGLGNTEVLVYGLMLIFTFIFGSQMIGFGTLANMILIGYVIDLCRWIWKNIGFAQFICDSSFTVRAIIFTTTLLCFVIVASIYINAQMGVAPYDAIPNILSVWTPKIPFALIRISFDLAAVAVGIIAGKLNPDGIQGSIVGSVLMSLLLGPVISLVGKPLKKIL